MWGRIGEIKSVGDFGLLVIFVRYFATFKNENHIRKDGFGDGGL
jgi:hypothetical protein